MIAIFDRDTVAALRHELKSMPALCAWEPVERKPLLDDQGNVAAVSGWLSYAFYCRAHCQGSWDKQAPANNACVRETKRRLADLVSWRHQRDCFVAWVRKVWCALKNEDVY